MRSADHTYSPIIRKQRGKQISERKLGGDRRLNILMDGRQNLMEITRRTKGERGDQRVNTDKMEKHAEVGSLESY